MNKVRKSLRVCIVALNAYPAIEPKAGKAIGGLETRAWNLAVGLSRQPDVEVFFVVGHTRPLVKEVVEGVTLVPVVDRLRDIRFDVSSVLDVKPRFPWCRLKGWSSKILWQLPLLIVTRPFRDRRPMHERLTTPCEQLMPDVCVSFGVGAQSASVVRAAEHVQRPSIVALASNAELDARFYADSKYIGKYGDSSHDLRYSVEHATTIMCQTPWQHDKLLEIAGRESVVVPPLIRLERWSSHPRTELGEHVLWVGRYDRFHKRPHLCLEIAQLCPELPFVMIINRGDAHVENEIRRHAPSNVRILDYVPANEMPSLFRRSRVSLVTGSNTFEGFPNVLLEAAASGTPVVTLEDFGGFVAASGCGRCSHGDPDLAVEQLRLLWDRETEWQDCSSRGQDWVLRFHSLDRVVNQFRDAIDEVVGQTSANANGL